MTAGAHRYAAFFDVDGTLIRERSLLSFLDFASAALGWNGEAWFREFYAGLLTQFRRGVPRAELNARFYRVLRGQRVDTFTALGGAWYEQVSARPDFFNDAMLAEFERHRRSGARMVLVTGSFWPLVQPLRNVLRYDALLASAPEVREGLYTGELTARPCIGLGKAEAVLAYTEANGLAPELCHAYGDDESDRPMLEAVGFAHMITSPSSLERELQARLRAVSEGEGAAP